VRITRRKDLVFGEVRPWRWHFTQKKLPFLASYLLGFVESLVRGGARTEGRRDGSQRVVFRKRSIEALLAAGVAEHSIRVAQWLRRLTEVRAERAGYYTSGQIANVLGVDRRIVLQWLDTGSVRYVRFGKWRYIPARALHKLTWLS
jgi:excisionase family DNA binding protein